MKTYIILLCVIITSHTYTMESENFHYPSCPAYHDISAEAIKTKVAEIENIQLSYSHAHETLRAQKQLWNEKIQSLSDWYNEVITQEFSIKNYDILINNPTLLDAINFNQNINYFTILQLGQKYLLQYASLSKQSRYKIFAQLEPILTTSYDHLWVQPYLIQQEHQLLPVLQDAYARVWHYHKHCVLQLLCQNLYIAQTESQKHAQYIQCHIYQQNILAKDHAYYLDMLLNFPMPHNNSEGTLSENTQISDTDQAVTTTNELIDNIASQSVPSPQEKRKKIKIKKQSGEKAPVLSPQEQAALIAAQQRAEQSKRDKEQHQLALLRKKEAQEAEQKLSSSRSQSLMKHQKSKNKSKATKSPEQTDPDDEILNAAIAQAQSEQNAIDLTILKKALPDFETPILNISPTVFDKSDSTTTQDDDLIAYQHFINTYTQKKEELNERKEQQKKDNLKKLLRAKACDREDLRYTMEQELKTQYQYASKIEKDILDLFQQFIGFLKLLPTKDISIEDFNDKYAQLLKAEQYIHDQEKSKLAWYLALHKDLYQQLKDAYIELKSIITDETTQLQNNYSEKKDKWYRDIFEQELKTLYPEYNAYQASENRYKIMQKIESMVSNHGIFDVHKYIHIPKTQTEFDELVTLKQEDLEESRQAIQTLLASTDNFHITQPEIYKLCMKAGIPKNPSLIEKIITLSAGMNLLDEEDKTQLTSLELFSSLQHDLEMNTYQFNEHQLADLTTIFITVSKSFMKITKSQV